MLRPTFARIIRQAHEIGQRQVSAVEVVAGRVRRCRSSSFSHIWTRLCREEIAVEQIEKTLISSPVGCVAMASNALATYSSSQLSPGGHTSMTLS